MSQMLLIKTCIESSSDRMIAQHMYTILQQYEILFLLSLQYMKFLSNKECIECVVARRAKTKRECDLETYS